jgi:hypothetical protein
MQWLFRTLQRMPTAESATGERDAQRSEDSALFISFADPSPGCGRYAPDDGLFRLKFAPKFLWGANLAGLLKRWRLRRVDRLLG